MMSLWEGNQTAWNTRKGTTWDTAEELFQMPIYKCHIHEIISTGMNQVKQRARIHIQ